VSQTELEAIHARLRAQILGAGGRLDAVLCCPHHPDEGCPCRKPQPGLLHQAAAHFGLELAECVFVGDSLSDLQAANAAGCPAIHVATGLAGRAPAKYARFSAPDLAAAVDLLEAAAALPGAAVPAAVLTFVKEK
ncbi:MAG: HAD-IIIA family hydrolase, partial [Caldilineaceae bacterium]